MGGGVSSAIARALGAGRREDADATILHALIIAAGFAAFFSISVIAVGPWLYAALGGRGSSLAVALTYSNIVFAGVILIWLFNTLANVIRGTGNTFVPAVVTLAGAALLVPLSAALIFGFGAVPAFGVAGGAIGLSGLLWRGLAGLRLLPLVRPCRGDAEASGDAAPLAAVSRHPADRPARVADFDHDQRHHRADHRRGRRLRSSRDRRLWRRHPARIHAHSRWPSASAGRWSRWSAPTWARAIATGRCARPGSAAGSALR